MPSESEHEVSLLDIWRIAWKQRLIIISATVLFAIGSVIVALSLTPIYRSEATLAAAEQNQEGNIGSQLGGLASLAGIRLGASNGSEINLAILRSRSFVEEFISENELLPVLYAEEWDADAKAWLPAAANTPPKMFDAVKLFRDDIFSVQEDPITGLVTVSIEWTDAEVATEWLKSIIEKINQQTRERALAESGRNLEYLNEQLQRASIVTLQGAISSLIESELQNEMLAKAREEYAYQVIDEPMVPTRRVRPARTLIVLMSTVLGGLIGVLLAIIRHSVSTDFSRRPTAS